MRLGVTTNSKQVESELDAFAAAIAIAAPRAANKLLDQAQTVGVRSIASIYGVGQRDFTRYLRRREALQGSPSAALIAGGRGFPLASFQPRQTKRGVSVRIKGRRIVIPHTFLASMRSGHQGVFARGAYKGRGVTRLSGETFGRFRFGRRRLPINELFTFGPSDALANTDVIDAMNERVDEQQGKVLKQEIAFALRGFLR